MNRLILIALVTLSILVITSCEKKQKNVELALLDKSWTNSFEEQSSENIKIFRPGSYKDYPVSRYRQVFIFYEDQVCEYLVLAENDGHYMTKGKWEYDDHTNNIKIFDLNTEMVYEFKIIELKDDVLKLKTKN